MAASMMFACRRCISSAVLTCEPCGSDVGETSRVDETSHVDEASHVDETSGGAEASHVDETSGGAEASHVDETSGVAEASHVDSGIGASIIGLTKKGSVVVESIVAGVTLTLGNVPLGPKTSDPCPIIVDVFADTWSSSVVQNSAGATL